MFRKFVLSSGALLHTMACFEKEKALCSAFLGPDWRSTERISVERCTKGCSNKILIATLHDKGEIVDQVMVKYFGVNLMRPTRLIQDVFITCYLGHMQGKIPTTINTGQPNIISVCSSYIHVKVRGIFENGRIEEYIPSYNISRDRFEREYERLIVLLGSLHNLTDIPFPRSKAFIKADIESKNSESLSGPIFELFSDDASITTKEQLVERIGTADLNDILLAIIANHRVSAGRVAKLEKRVSQLEEQVTSLGEQLQHQSLLEDRVLRQEAYSGRNTIILDGLPESTNETPETLEKRMISVAQCPAPMIRPEDLGIVHRNGKRKEKPRSVTCVFTKARNKDSVMKKESRETLRKTVKVAAFHRMSEGLAEWFEIEQKGEVDWFLGTLWVAFSGHRLFTVCRLKNIGNPVQQQQEWGRGNSLVGTENNHIPISGIIFRSKIA
eukprot:sb/3479681/